MYMNITSNRLFTSGRFKIQTIFFQTFSDLYLHLDMKLTSYTYQQPTLYSSILFITSSLLSILFYPNIWNSLPPHIQRCNTFLSFKRLLKSTYFRNNHNLQFAVFLVFILICLYFQSFCFFQGAFILQTLQSFF